MSFNIRQNFKPGNCYNVVKRRSFNVIVEETYDRETKNSSFSDISRSVSSREC